MIRNLIIRHYRLTIAFNLNIFAVIFTNRNTWINNIWNDKHDLTNFCLEFFLLCCKLLKTSCIFVYFLLLCLCLFLLALSHQSMCRAVQMLCGLELAIKWVNDLYYKGKKVCGILTEAGTDLESGQLEWLVVGIGLNLTATAEDFPPELAAKAGSLYPGGPAPVSRAALAGAIGRELLALCPGFACLDEYRARCFVPGHWVTVCTGTETYAAQALSIDDTGRLVVQREGGRTEALRCGEVTIRPTKTE